MKKDSIDDDGQYAFQPSRACEELGREVIDASFVVHRELGPGFSEKLYEHALAVELNLRGVPFSQQLVVPIHYRGVLVGEYQPDLILDKLIVIELKAIRTEPVALHVAQVLSYLRATRLNLGFVINFGLPYFKEGVKRVVLPPRPSPPSP
ncbi:MAG TPA: GxxExxY protein [Kofleriaceae bacterium]|jgi:GxxExxY protein